MENILLCGEQVLQELKQILQEKQRYNSVLASLDSEIDGQKLKIESCRKEMEQEVSEEEQRRRELVAKPYYDEIASCEVEINRITLEREKQRQVQIDAIVRQETEEYETKKNEIEAQIKEVKKEENVPAVCLSRPFLAFFCPRTGKDALFLVAGILVLLLVLPMALYYGVYGGKDKSALLVIYLVLIVFFYTAYLLINNLVKDKYLVGLQKILAFMTEQEKLEQKWKQRVKELENIPDYELDLKEFDDEVLRIQMVIGELNGQKDMALVTFDSNERLKLDIMAEVQEKYKPQLEQLQLALDELNESYDKMRMEFKKFLEEKQIEERYLPLQRLESGIFNPKVIDELIFYICHGDAENIREAIMKRKRKIGEMPVR